VLVGGIPVVGWDVPAMVALSVQHRVSVPEPPSRSEIEKQSEFVDGVFKRLAQLDGVTFIPVIDPRCNERCRVTAENRALYSDPTEATCRSSEPSGFWGRRWDRGSSRVAFGLRTTTEPS
jgi:hypothetical protein